MMIDSSSFIHSSFLGEEKLDGRRPYVSPCYDQRTIIALKIDSSHAEHAYVLAQTESTICKSLRRIPTEEIIRMAKHVQHTTILYEYRYR